MIAKFLKDSKTFNSIVFNGNYDMPVVHFIALLNHFSNTGKNLLDHYSSIIYMSWNVPHISSIDEYNRKREIISTIRKLRLIDSSVIHESITNLELGLRNYNHLQTLIDSEPRRKACVFTSKVDVKKAIFDIHGENCLCCGDGNNISLDHIIPVYKGGLNEINNLQPLCKSCNSRKGTKIIDYRK